MGGHPLSLEGFSGTGPPGTWKVYHKGFDVTIRDLQKKIADALNGVEALVQNGCKVFAEDMLTTQNDLNNAVATAGRIAVVVVTPRFERDGFAGRGLSLSRTFFEQHGRKHMEGNEHRRSNMPLSAGDYELLPTVWRSPERVQTGDRPERVVLELDTIDGGILALTVDVRDGIKSYFKRKNPLEAPAANARLSLSGSRAGPGQRTGRSIP